MHLIEQYLDCLTNGDAEKMASLFSNDAVFYDEGPAKMGADPVDIKGKETIKTFFEQVFTMYKPIKAYNILINGNALRYDLKLGDLTFFALGLMKIENNLISEYRVKVL